MSETCTVRTELPAPRAGVAEDASGKGKHDANAKADATATVVTRRMIDAGCDSVCDILSAF
jgi:hypothetical protein